MRLLVPTALALAGLPLSGAAQAAAVVIWPVDPVIRGGEQATALWLENKGDQPISLQVRALGWAQPEGDEALAQQDEVIASPPIARVAPGARQLVRIIRRAPPAPGAPLERSYRLLVDELPQPPPEDGGPPSARLAVQMRYSIPLFTYAGDPKAAAPALVASVRVTRDGRELVLRNTGALHARLTDLRIAQRGHEQVLKGGLAGYVLPGATLRIPLPMEAAGALKVAVNGVDQTLAPSI